MGSAEAWEPMGEEDIRRTCIELENGDLYVFVMESPSSVIESLSSDQVVLCSSHLDRRVL